MKRRVQMFLLLVFIAELIIMASVAFATETAEAAEPQEQVDLIKIQRKFYGDPDIKDDIKDIVMVLFLTIGPLRIVPAFAKLTTNADDTLRKQLAFRSFWVSTLTIVLVALLGQWVLGNYQIS